MGDIADEDRANYSIRGDVPGWAEDPWGYDDTDSDGTEDVTAGYDPRDRIQIVEEDLGASSSDLLHALLVMGRKRGMRVDTSHLRGQVVRRREKDYPELAMGDQRGRLPKGETLHDQLAREHTPEGRRLSQQIAWSRSQGWSDQSIQGAYVLSAQRITREVLTMASAIDTDQVLARIRRMGVPDNIQSLVMSLPVHVLAQALMKEDPADKRFPAEPPEHAVLLWEQAYPGSETVYHYVAIRAGDQWWITGRPDRNPSPIGWPDLEKKIGNSPCRIATQWGEFPVIEKSPGLNPAEWFEKVIKNRNAVDPRDDEESNS